jgi:hypothetical protein
MITFGFANTQMAAIARICVRLGARHMEHAGPTEGGETVGSSSGGGEFSPGRGLGRHDHRRPLGPQSQGSDQGRQLAPAANGLIPTALAGRAVR